MAQAQDTCKIEPDQLQLGDTSSVGGKIWRKRLDAAQERNALALMQQLGLAEPLARLLAFQNLEADEVEAYLHPKLRDLMPDPYTLTDMEKGARRIVEAIQAHESIAILGDYDVDGATSTSLFLRFLAHHGLAADFHIPDRQIEGYGPNVEAIKALHEKGVQLLITVDCGTMSFEPLELARDLGLDVVVVDHHQTGETLPSCHALINPNRQDDLSGLTYLAAVGVSFLTLVAVTRLLREKGAYRDKEEGEGEKPLEPPLMAWLALVALGTICDIVPLVGLNRPFVQLGMEAIQAGSISGITTLLEKANYYNRITPQTCGFVIGPRLNASGRLSDASLATQLLSSSDPVQLDELAERLDHLNSHRQTMERQALDDALMQLGLEGEEDKAPSLIMLGDENWHVGIIGLLAARIKEKFNRPTFVLHFDKKGQATGSGRSIPAIDLGKIVLKAVDEGLLIKGGGHAMAAGLTFERSRLDEVQAFFLSACEEQMSADSLTEYLEIDSILSAASATLDLWYELEQAGPFGSGNKRPLFMLPHHRISFAKALSEGQHLRLQIKSVDGASLPGIAFRIGDTALGERLQEVAQTGEPVHLAGFLEINDWQGRESVQFRLIDMANA